MGLWVQVFAGTVMGYRGDTHGFSHAIAYELTKIIGIKITQTKSSISISQKTYIKSTLECKGLSEINSVVTPMDLNMKLQPNLDGNKGNSFTRPLRELQYLAGCTRPNISFAMNQLAVCTSNLSLQYATALKEILQYLAEKKTLASPILKPPTILTINSNISMDLLMLPMQTTTIIN